MPLNTEPPFQFHPLGVERRVLCSERKMEGFDESFETFPMNTFRREGGNDLVQSSSFNGVCL